MIYLKGRLKLEKCLTSVILVIVVIICTTYISGAYGIVVNYSKRKELNSLLTKQAPTKLFLTGQSNVATNDKDTTGHPLDPLTSSEIRLAKFIINSLRGYTRWVYKYITLREPEKFKLVRSFLQNNDVPVHGPGFLSRKALVMLLDPVTYEYYEAVVNLNKFTLEGWKRQKYVGPTVTMDDVVHAEDVAFANMEVVKRVHNSGYNLSQIVCDTWDAGYIADNPNYAHCRKLLQVYFYALESKEDNFYAHPLDFVVYVDLLSNSVRGIETFPTKTGFSRSNSKTGKSTPVPKAKANYHDPSAAQQLTRLQPIQITQPNGPSFKLHGYRLTWHNFILRVGYSGREGVTLHHVKYKDKDEVRPIIYRISLSEVLMIYGDSRPPYHRKKSLDMGEYKLGSTASQLPRNTFCPGEAHYLDMLIHNDAGEPIVLPDSICIFEEDNGPLWAHYDRPNDKTVMKRSQRLSISFLATLGHSDYWISWRLYQDATIELSVKLTGLKSTNLMGVDVKAPPHGKLMSPQVYSQITQCFIAVRIDADVDSDKNSVATQDIVALDGEVGSPTNPYGNGIVKKETLLKTTEASRTNLSPGTGRTWKILNTNRGHPVTKGPVSWKLVSKGENVPLLLKKNSPLKGNTTMNWTDYNVWALPYNDEQIFASGLWMKGDGLWDWANANMSANIVNTDIVLWHTFGITSVPSMEDWPVSSDSQGNTGFILKPDSFFDRNPAL